MGQPAPIPRRSSHLGSAACYGRSAHGSHSSTSAASSRSKRRQGNHNQFQTLKMFPDGHLGFELEFDLVTHALVIRVSDGGERRIELGAGNVAAFYGSVLDALQALRVPVKIDQIPNELPDPTPFSRDVTPRVYEPDAAHRFWRALVQCDRVFKQFRTR